MLLHFLHSDTMHWLIIEFIIAREIFCKKINPFETYQQHICWVGLLLDSSTVIRKSLAKKEVNLMGGRVSILYVPFGNFTSMIFYFYEIDTSLSIESIKIIISHRMYTASCVCVRFIKSILKAWMSAKSLFHLKRDFLHPK